MLIMRRRLPSRKLFFIMVICTCSLNFLFFLQQIVSLSCTGFLLSPWVCDECATLTSYPIDESKPKNKQAQKLIILKNKFRKGKKNMPFDVERARLLLCEISSMLESVRAIPEDLPGSIVGMGNDVQALLNRFTHRFCQKCSPHPYISNSVKRDKEINIPSPNINVTVIKDDEMKESFTSFFIPRPEVLNDISYKYILHNTLLCTMPSGQKPFLLILVPTVNGSVHVRKVIRETWGSLVYNGGRWGNFVIQEGVRLLFFLGDSSLTLKDMKQIEAEANQFGDILLADFVDSYQNLSLKMAIGLSWIYRYCDGVGHVVKVDEDTFLHVPKLIAALKHVQRTHNSFVLGHRHNAKSPPVIREGRWAVENSTYPMSFFPSYVYGHSYVVSGPAVREILKAFQHMPLVPNEDAYMTGILSKAANVIRLHNKYFAAEDRAPMICQLSDGIYISVTNCCEEHLQAIYHDMLHGSCDYRFLYNIDAPSCSFFGY